MADEYDTTWSDEQRRRTERSNEVTDEDSDDAEKRTNSLDSEEIDKQRRSTTPLLSGDDVTAVGLFGKIRERRVAFCIDTSGSMYDCLDSVKEYLIAALERRAERARKCDAFNIVEFSTSVAQWADEMVAWTPATVAVASRWIRELCVKTGTNTRDALIAALVDPTCDAVYLVTDSVPDQPVDEVLSAVLRAAANRPVHCRYIQRHAADSTALSFLRDLAMETFGSLQVVTMSAHGDVLDTTSVYKADRTAERMVRTTYGNVFPSGYKMCSVGTSLDGPIPTASAAVTAVVAPTVPPWPYCLYPWPYRYYYTVLDAGGPAAMRWRMAKAWMKHTHELADRIVTAPVPGAGSMLVGARVLARRHRDGFFYMGTVKSQILDHQFLVEFGPCKHGKFTDTEYQETYVYDIVSHSDALRHPIMVDDYVLAPWESEGERYAPAVVISGLEKRMADGGGEDTQLVATFHNGKTVSVEKGKAMWIPHDLYERTVFEIGLPKNVRQEFATQDLYPYYPNYGYPSSGSLAFPAQFDQVVPQGYVGTGCRTPVGWGSASCRGYPWMVRSQSASAVRGRSELIDSGMAGGDEMIPGTDLTKSQLNSKVMAQIMQNKLADRQTGSDDGRLLKKRATNDTGILKKSVSFVDLEDAQSGDLSDSGHGSQVDLNLSDVDDDDQSPGDGANTLRTRDAAVGTRLGRTPRRPRTASPQRQWRYWNNDPAPSLLEPKHYGQYREGPYRDCVESVSVLLRDAKKTDLTKVLSESKKTDHNAVEWTSPINRVVDSLACYKYQPGVKDCLGYVPLSYKPQKQQPGRDPCEVLGARQLSAESLAEVRRAYRQRQVLAREIGWQRRIADEQEARQAAMEARRQRSSAQLDRDQARVDEQRADAERRLQAKRQHHEQLQQRFRDNADEFGEKQARRIAALTEKRINRNLEASERAADAAELHARRQATREMRNVSRMESQMARVAEQERQAAAQYEQTVRNRAARDRDFRQREIEKQQRKEREADIVDQQRVIYRAQVLP